MILSTFIHLALAVLSCTQEPMHPGAESSSKLSGEKLMNKVFDRFHINYEMSRQHRIGYYKESMSENGQLYYCVEGIVDIYTPTNLSQRKYASISPIKVTKKTFRSFEEDDLLGGNAADMARSSIWRPNSFLSEKNRGLYSYKYKGDTIVHNTVMHIIHFSPADQNGYAKGRLLVDRQSFAIMEIRYQPILSSKGEWKKIRWKESFLFKDGAYELSKVAFTGVSSESHKSYSVTLMMDDHKVISDIPAHKEYIDIDASLFETAQEGETEDVLEHFNHYPLFSNPNVEMWASEH